VEQPRRRPRRLAAGDGARHLRGARHHPLPLSRQRADQWPDHGAAGLPEIIVAVSLLIVLLQLGLPLSLFTVCWATC
jgi:hypothetical protein